MRIDRMTWMQVEAYLERDDRVVLPLGSTEQHAYLSLATDALLAERVAADAAEPLGVPVYPVVPYGLSPYFMGYPGTVTLRPATYAALIEDVVTSLVDGGFRRILILNGHGGNAPAREAAEEVALRRPPTKVRFHDWWRAPATMAAVRAVDPDASHASWMESFPWTRVPGASPPDGRKPMVDLSRRHEMSPGELRAHVGDGSFGGPYERSDEDMAAVWDVAVRETRALLERPWDQAPAGTPARGQP